MLATVAVATAHEERRWPAWLSAGQDDAVRTVANTQGAISQTTLLTTFSRIYNPTAVSISIYNAINALYGLKILILIAAGLQIMSGRKMFWFTLPPFIFPFFREFFF
jgi:hypothetical protein